MVDIFLMGTAGQSKWREPIKAECDRLGITYYDPVVPEWNEEARRREADALKHARVIVMAITEETAGIASLAESGWAALSAIKRGQAFGIFVDPVFGPEEEVVNTGVTGFGGWLLDLFGGKDRNRKEDSLEDASQRARKLVISHLTKLKSQFPELAIHTTGSLDGLQKWAISTVQKLATRPSKKINI